MIRHIIRKDFQLLWPLVVAVIALDVVTTALLELPGPLQRSSGQANDEYGWISNGLLPFVSLLGLVVLVLSVIHQDRFPGTNQDWLTRPIPRRTLVFAKAMFVCLAGILPAFVCDISTGVLAHLPLGDVIAASAVRSVMLFTLVVLPAALVGVVTRKLTDALVIGVMLLVIGAIEAVIASKLQVLPPLIDTNYAWVLEIAFICASLIVVPVIISLQFQWRSTNRLRPIVVVILAASPVILLIPSQWVLSALRSASHGGQSIGLSLAAASTARNRITWPNSKENYGPRYVPMATVSLPTTVTLGSSLDAWRLDHEDIRIILPSGETLYRADESRFGLYASRTVERPDAKETAAFGGIPVAVAKDAIARHATLELTLVVTALSRTFEDSTETLDTRTLDGFSRCRRVFNGEIDKIHCISTRPVAACMLHADEQGVLRDLSWKGDTCRRTPYAPIPMGFWRDAYYTAELPVTTGGEEPDDRKKSPKQMVENFVARAHEVHVLKVPMDGLIQDVHREPLWSRDGLGAGARFGSLSAPVSDRDGVLYVVDPAENVLRRITPSGETTTLAGVAGACGHTDGHGALARFCRPSGIAIDATGMLYVVDVGNLLIRKVTPSGDVTTVTAIADPKTTPYPDRWLRGDLMTRAPDGSFYVVGQYGEDNTLVVRIGKDGAVTAFAGQEKEQREQE